ncbi:ATP-dependent DNA helicase 2 subunit KU70 [Dendrobium catenatum]|uniref:ATP-dependent DNA helicase 2 subunit KU70 n=2 Tax=Dendrobium catenatum TaxID=906689 RepID=A0A2I0W8A1_9ASPA|nr:ATP-dependent DNA helicase 2 subunit KU70 [Dendrobium catenatum]
MEESILRQRKVDNLPCNSKDVRDKVMSDSLTHNSFSKAQKAEKNEALGKRSFDKENKSKEGKSDASMKMKTKQNSDSSDVISKVFDFHARGKLQSLTVSDLKCFLASKKMKVGGKKEELIGRITAMLD